MGAPDRSYGQDFFAWTEEQAKALRDRAIGNGSNLPLDWENLAEEVESLGRAERNALGSHVARILRHLLKLKYSPAFDPQRGWRISIQESRAEVRRLLNASPSLRTSLDVVIAEEMPDAVALAATDLEAHGEFDAADALRAGSATYRLDQILGPWFPNGDDPASPGSKDEDRS